MLACVVEARHVPEALYVGGSLDKFDYVLSKEVCIETLDMFSDGVGIEKWRRYYTIVNKGFKLLIDNNDLRREWKKVLKYREMHIYVECIVGEGAGEEDVVEIAGEGIGEGAGEGAGVGTGVEFTFLGEEGDDILVDSDYEIDGDKNEEQINEPGRVEEEIMGETNESSGEASDEEEADVMENDGDLEEHRESDVGEGDGHSHPVFNPTEIYDPIFELGMLFSNKSEFKKALQSHAIQSKRTLKFTKNDKQRVYVHCGAIDCEWKMHAIKVNGEETFQINLLCDHHSCPQIFDVKNVKTNWIKDKYLQKFKSDPKRCVKGFGVDIINDLRVNVSRHQAYRAKKATLKEIEGSPE
ncbi:UNVERIFIED_CONTAM: hypothetical protein Slati_1405600 [Sesamum latifolium]|uniref:Transposase MuDR plant domain-containing protein n=1 Tax=Sesamum latifolium TaxID=2727402 RepID=A0AAW2X386_9LAMI